MSKKSREPKIKDIPKMMTGQNTDICWNWHTKLLFVHIPKNAGTSIMRDVLHRKNLVNGSPYHVTADQYNAIEGYEKCKSFAFSREPFERFVSVYLWRKRKDELVKSSKVEDILEMLADDKIQQPAQPYSVFDWEPFQRSEKTKLCRMFLPQSRWINQNTVFIGKVETIAESVLQLQNTYAFPAKPWEGCPDLKKPTRISKQNKNPTHHGKERRAFRKELLDIMETNPHLKKLYFEYYVEDYDNLNYAAELPRE